MASSVFSFCNQKTGDLQCRIASLEQKENPLLTDGEEFVRISSDMDHLQRIVNTVENLTEDERAQLFSPLFDMQERMDNLKSKATVDLTTLVSSEVPVDIDSELVSLREAVQELLQRIQKSPFIKHEDVLEREGSLKGRVEVLGNRVDDESRAFQILEIQSSLRQVHFDYFKNQFLLLQNGGLSDLKGRFEQILGIMQNAITFILQEELSGVEKESALVFIAEIEASLQDTLAVLEIDNPEVVEGFKLLLSNEKGRFSKEDQEELLAQQLSLAVLRD